MLQPIDLCLGPSASISQCFVDTCSTSFSQPRAASSVFWSAIVLIRQAGRVCRHEHDEPKIALVVKYTQLGCFGRQRGDHMG
jgi:hypothetical protein